MTEFGGWLLFFFTGEEVAELTPSLGAFRVVKGFSELSISSSSQPVRVPVGNPLSPVYR